MGHLFQGRERSAANEHSTAVLPETFWATENLPTGTPPENTVIVTISRQLGSKGAEIGRLVAEESGLQYVDHQIINEVARRMGVDVQAVQRQDEQSSDMVNHVLQALRSTTLFSTNYASLFNAVPNNTQTNEAAYLQLTQRVILEAASQGNAVIVGRGSQFLLHNAPRTLHISIFSPLPYRIENVMKQQNVDHARAQQLIEQRDFEHASYLRRYYGSDGKQPGLYHLLINTSLFPQNLAAAMIRQSLHLIKEIAN